MVARVTAFGQAQHVDRAVYAGLGGLHRVELVVHRAGRAGEVADAVDLQLHRLGDVVAQQLEARVADQRYDVVARAGEEVVEAEHLVAVGEQPFAQVRADEAGTAVTRMRGRSA